MTKNIISNAVNMGENAVADVEMGIVEAENELKADEKGAIKDNDSKKNE